MSSEILAPKELPLSILGKVLEDDILKYVSLFSLENRILDN